MYVSHQKKIVFTEKKTSSDSKNLVALNLDKYLLLIKQKQKKFKKTEMHLNETIAEKQERQKCKCQNIFRTSVNQAHNERGGRGLSCPFLKIKKCPDFGEKGTDCFHL